MRELVEGVDIHENNKSRLNLPERRLAKIFVFRLIYGGQAYSYAHDSNFNSISKSVNYWQGLIDEFYEKYQGIAKWHETLVRTVLDSGRLVMPTGRTYLWDRGDVVRNLWRHRPKILNYPVQGLGADLVAIGRVTIWRRLRAAGIPHLFISTVHDSLDIDCETCYTSSICSNIKSSFEDVPKNFQRLFGVPFDLPINSEIGYGLNIAELTPYKG